MRRLRPFERWVTLTLEIELCHIGYKIYRTALIVHYLLDLMSSNMLKTVLKDESTYHWHTSMSEAPA